MTPIELAAAVALGVAMGRQWHLGLKSDSWFARSVTLAMMLVVIASISR